MRDVVMFSGGLSSWAAAKVVARERGTADLVLLFADTKYEDADLYRFLLDAAANVGAPLVTVAEGRTPWQVFRDEGMIGGTRADLCSRVLKRDVLDAWLRQNRPDAADTTVHVGFRWHERHRFEGGRGVRGLRARYAALGYRCEAPLLAPPYLSHDEIAAWAQREGLDPPSLYDEGFPSNNCGGRCVKQGHAGWRRLLRVRPESFREVETEEEAFRARAGKDVAILRDRRGGKTVPLPLAELRRRVEDGERCDLFAEGGCGCFAGDD